MYTTNTPHIFIYTHTLYIYERKKREREGKRDRYIDRAHICGEMLTTEETERRRDGDGSSLYYISNSSVTLRYLK